MTIVEFLILLLVAGVAGGIAKLVAGYAPGGFLISIGLGFLGALFGTWLAAQLDLPLVFGLSVGGTVFPLVWAIVGAGLIVFILSFFARRRVA